MHVRDGGAFASLPGDCCDLEAAVACAEPALHPEGPIAVVQLDTTLTNCNGMDCRVDSGLACVFEMVGPHYVDASVVPIVGGGGCVCPTRMKTSPCRKDSAALCRNLSALRAQRGSRPTAEGGSAAERACDMKR